MNVAIFLEAKQLQFETLSCKIEHDNTKMCPYINLKSLKILIRCDQTQIM
jgi:hypothetical protein